MTDLRTAAQQALEALESLFTLQADDARPKQCGDAITALRAALEQPEQDPVACIRTWHKKNGDQHAELWDWCDGIGSLPEGEHLLYTHPPRREWRGLTDAEIRDLWSWSATAEAERTATTQQHAFARAIEAALKEKNQ